MTDEQEETEPEPDDGGQVLKEDDDTQSVGETVAEGVEEVHSEPSETEVEDAVENVDGVDKGTDMMSFLTNGGIKQLLLDDSFEDPETGNTYSQADLVADVINVMRMDAKQMCLLHGIDVEVDKMSPERAAELLENVAQNDGIAIIEVFQAIEDKRDHVFKQQMTEAEYEQYMDFKRGMLYSL